jgi:hypothetical protein
MDNIWSNIQLDFRACENCFAPDGITHRDDIYNIDIGYALLDL